VSTNSDDDKFATDPVLRHGHSVFIATLLWIALLQGKSKTLTWAQLDGFQEVCIFPSQIREIQRAFRCQPDKLIRFHELLRCSIFEVTVSRERFLDAYQGWSTLYLSASSAPNAKWYLPELWRALNMESRAFFTRIRAANLAAELMTADPIERQFGQLIGLHVS
jgi:hypothetical protein